MNFKVSIYIILSGAFALFSSSCKLINPYRSPDVNYSQLYRGVSDTSDTNSIAKLKWDELFTDSELQSLIRKGIEKNLDLQMAYSRILQSKAYYRQSKAMLFPGLNANAGASWNHTPDWQLRAGTPQDVTQYQLGLSSNWELDIWGKLASSRRASLAALLQTEAARNAIQSQIVSTIAQYYYTLLALDQQLSITEETVKNWDTTVETIKALKIAAKVTGAAVVQSEAQKYAAEVTIPDLKHNIREIENAMSILLGEAPQEIKRTDLGEQKILKELTTGVPAQLLAYRPDVQQAELAFRQMFELSNVAKTYFYPALTISASAGFNNINLKDLINPVSLAANIGGGLMQPIFNNRQNKTRLEVAKAQQEEALFNFQKALLIAGQEVSDALSLYKTALDKMSVRAKQVESLEKSVEYSQELLENGFAIYTEVITARQSLLQAELGRVNDRFQELQAIVELYRALGGGWEN